MGVLANQQKGIPSSDLLSATAMYFQQICRLSYITDNAIFKYSSIAFVSNDIFDANSGILKLGQ